MADDDGFVLTGGSFDAFDNLDDALIAALKSATEDIAFFVAQRAQVNAPIDTGDLRASIIGRVKSADDQGVEAVVEATMPYALKMHEELTPFGRYNLGPLSRAAAAAPIKEGGPGGKFIARAVDTNIPVIQKKLIDALNNVGVKSKVDSNRPGFNPGAFFPPGRF